MNRLGAGSLHSLARELHTGTGETPDGEGAGTCRAGRAEDGALK